MFLAIYPITQAKTGLSALTLKRQIGVSYNTAWSLKQKIMQVMKERSSQVSVGGLLPRFAYVAVRTPPMPGRFLKLAEAYG